MLDVNGHLSSSTIISQGVKNLKNDQHKSNILHKFINVESGGGWKENAILYRNDGFCVFSQWIIMLIFHSEAGVLPSYFVSGNKL